MTATKTIQRWARPAQILMILAICVVLVTICQLIVFQFTWEYTRRTFLESQPQNPVVSEADRAMKEISDSRKEFLPDGTVLLVTDTMEPDLLTRAKTIRVADANNHTLYEGSDKNPYSFISWSDEGPRYFETATSLTEVEGYYGGNADFSRMLCVRTLGPDLRWSGTWVYDLALGAFVGYNLDGRVTGYLGAQGLCLRKQEIQPFEKGLGLRRAKKAGAVNLTAVWISAHSAYLIDFEAIKVRQVFHSDDDRMRFVQISHWDDPNTGLYLPILAISTERGRGTIYIPDPERFIQIHVPPEWYWAVAATQSGVYLSRHRIVGYPQSHDHRAVSQWLLQNRYRPKQHISQLMKVQDDGDLRLISSFEWTQPGQVATSTVAWEQLPRWINHAFAVVSPLPFKYASIWGEDMYQTQSSKYLRHLVKPLFLLEIHGPSNLVITFVLVSLAFLHAWPRRTGWGWFVFWVILVLAFNLAGLLTYLAMNHTPVIRCSACGRRRGLLRPDCHACHSPLPVPQPRPTDLVFPAV